MECFLAGDARNPAVYALGGITAATAPACLAAGATGVAVFETAHDESSAQALVAALKISREIG